MISISRDRVRHQLRRIRFQLTATTHNDTSWQEAPTFQEFGKLKESILPNNESIQRFDCMKPYAALSHMLLPQPLISAPHTLEASSARLLDQWCKILGIHSNRRHWSLCKGVRDGLLIALRTIGSDCDEIIWPSDVYPVYEKIIAKCVPSARQLEFTTANLLGGGTFAANNCLKTASTQAVLLSTAPLSPVGRMMNDAEINFLLMWLQESRDRKVILDCVYSYDLQGDRHALQRLCTHPQVISLYSLSKSWLSPVLEPLVVSYAAADPSRAVSPIVPREAFSRGVGFIHCADEHFVNKMNHVISSSSLSSSASSASIHLQCSPSAVGQALALINTQPTLPTEQQARFARQWKHLAESLRKVYNHFQPPKTGYFGTIPVKYSTALQNSNALCVPGSVFGVNADHTSSIVSCLYYIKEMDTASERKSSLLPHHDNCNQYYHVTILSNFARGYDKYSRLYNKSHIPESTFPDKFFLLRANQLGIGIGKALALLRKLALDGDALIILHTDLTAAAAAVTDNNNNDLVVEPHPRGQYIRSNAVPLKGVCILRDGEEVRRLSFEEAYALSLTVNKVNLKRHEELTPRSVSVLPIAKGCQARCSFCFSKGSASADTAQKSLDPDRVLAVLTAARARGASRAVITGGGEPFLVPFAKLLGLIRQCSALYPVVCLISNGYYLTNQSEEERMASLRELDSAGLTVLSISRHAASDTGNEAIMKLNVPAERIARSWRAALTDDQAPLRSLTRLRWVCVLQKNGVHDNRTLEEYLEFAADSGASEICFKELYVSSSVESVYHDAASNRWSEENQVPLSLVINYLNTAGFKQCDRLPWGAPVYEGLCKGRTLKIAAYTEPSLFWERENGMCRSWNLMADGTILSSLEDKASTIDVPVV